MVPFRWPKQGAKFRRHLLIPVLAAAAGGLCALLLVSLFRARPVPLPVLPSAPSPPVVGPCVDLHSYACALVGSPDPTGEVRRDAEGEVEVLRVYERLMRTHRGLTPARADDLLVREVYTPERTRRLRAIFSAVQEHLLKFIDSQPFRALSFQEKALLRARVRRVRLELPPPASVYADEPGLFTRSEVYFERTADGAFRVRLGGALLLTVRSKFNLSFTLAHELAHAIDPCELRSDRVNILAYRGLAECFGAPEGALAGECAPSGKISEIFADWVATHVVADLLDEAAAGYTSTQLRSAVYNSVRDLCREDEEESTVSAHEHGLASSHPNVPFRVNRIFAQHPRIRKILGCKEVTGPLLPGMPAYCFWPSGK